MANLSDTSKKPKREEHIYRLRIEGVGHADAFHEQDENFSSIRILLSSENLLPEYEHPDMANWYDDVVSRVPSHIPTEIYVHGPGGKLINHHLLVPNGPE